MKVDRTVAEGEINAWLDKRKVFASTRELNKDSIDLLVDAMVEGCLTLDSDTGKFTHNLLHPYGEAIKVERLEYASRLNDKMVRPYLVGVKSNDGDGRLLAHLAALVNEQKEVLANMDSLDKKVAMAIAIFFL